MRIVPSIFAFSNGSDASPRRPQTPPERRPDLGLRKELWPLVWGFLNMARDRLTNTEWSATFRTFLGDGHTAGWWEKYGLSPVFVKSLYQSE